jgi:oxygen-independent coproporphyrinogen-3 oxidase
MSAAGQPLSAYLHIPFCERKCIYCDFYSIENLSLREEFVGLLLKEIDLKLDRYPELAGRPLHTIFFGGGTPSLLTPQELERIIVKLDTHFGIGDNIEFTLECNPGTVTLDKLRSYRELGVNRLSFGVQSFNAHELDFLGRIHNAEQSREAIRIARQAGFDNLSLDLIFALPGQSEAMLMNSLREAIALETDHISAYNLTVEHGTPLWRMVEKGSVIELDADRAAAHFEIVQNTLTDAGFTQYEISNYAKSEAKRAKHNLVYWDGYEDYVSFGPSAHEFVSGERAWNISSLEQYSKLIGEQKLPRINSERPSNEERRTEVLYVQLRSTGVRLVEFMQIFGEDLVLNQDVKYFLQDGLMEIHDGLLRLTQKGYRFCDGIVTKLLNSTEANRVLTS